MREQSTEFVRRILVKEGFSVADIDVCPSEKRADLLASYGSEEYLIEAKSREPHQGWNELMKQVKAEGYATASRSVDPWNSLSSTILEAYQQLLSTPATAEAFQVLWWVALDGDESFVMACMEKRLMGTERVFAAKLTMEPDMFNKPPKIVDCYYHSSNDFQRCPKLDAAVIGSEKGGKLLVNLHSDKRDQFRRSRLYTMFARHRAVIDAEVAEQCGEAFMLGRDFTESRNGKSQWAYIKDRYGLGTSVMSDNHFLEFCAIPWRCLVSNEPLANKYNQVLHNQNQ